MTSPIAGVIVLAAGQGKRMKSTLPKVLHEVCGRPMLLRVLDAVAALESPRTIVVLGHGHEQVRPLLPPACVVALQSEQRGTGHALLCAADDVPAGSLLVLPGDTPLITDQALLKLAREHQASAADATILTMDLDDPTGYGRMVRSADGSVSRIVEHRDATSAELDIHEVNSGIYVVPAPLIFDVLRRTGTDNDQGEIYLTDAVASLIKRGCSVSTSLIEDPSLAMGVNSAEQLALAEVLMSRRGDCHSDAQKRHR